MESPEINETTRIASQEAAYWAIRIGDEESLARKERALFQAWLRRSPENIAEFLRICSLENSLDDERLRKHLSHSLDGSISNVADIFNERPAHPPPSDHATGGAQRRDEARALLGLALSSTYLKHFRKGNRPAKMALGGLSLLTLMASTLDFPGSLSVAAVSLGFLAAVILKEAIVGYRISHGLFGSTASEIRVLLRFLIDNSNSIDFDDHNGKRRPVFEPAGRCDERPAIPVGATTE